MKRVILFFTLFPMVLFANSDSKMLIENEANTINVFKKNAKAVVNVSNIQRIRRSYFDVSGVEITQNIVNTISFVNSYIPNACAAFDRARALWNLACETGPQSPAKSSRPPKRTPP